MASFRLRLGLVGACIALVAVACSGQDRDGEPDGLPTEPFTLDVAIGECFDRPATPDVVDVDVVDCDEPHDFEAFATGDLDGDGYPGAEEVSAQSLMLCNERFADYVGRPPAQSGLVVVPVAPTDEQWQNGSRSVTCTVTRRVPERLEGSVEGSEPSDG